MNRRQRRAHRLPNRLAKLLACPDCNSDQILGHSGIEVHHDATCPWYAALQAAGGYGIRFGYGGGD